MNIVLSSLYMQQDKNPDNREEATEIFKKISEAYEVLSDPQKKRDYDRLGRPGRGFEADGMSFSHAQDLFNSFFGGANPFSFFNDIDDFMRGNMFGQRRSSGSRHGSFGMHDPFGMGMFGRDPFASMMGDMGDPFSGMSGSSTMSFHSSSSTMGGGGGTSRSVRKTVRIEDGHQVTRIETTIRHPDGRVETSVEEHAEERQLEDGHRRSRHYLRD